MEACMKPINAEEDISLVTDNWERDLDLSSDDDDYEVILDYNKGERGEQTSHEDKRTNKQFYESLLEQTKEKLIKEVRVKLNKLVMARWFQQRREFYVDPVALNRLKEELDLLRIMYEQLITKS